ncbi:hypothetical protein V8D89_007016 [Ganoderma adspersum]
MLGLTFAALAMSFMATLLPAAGYEGKLDIPYKTFADKYFLFLSINGIQFYLYVTQTMFADGLLTYTLYLKSNGNPKAYSHSAVCSVLGTLFGFFAFADKLWAIDSLVFTTVGVNLMSSGPMMQAALRSSDIVRRTWEWHPRALVNFLRSQEFYDATIQSAALYSLASFSLPVTFLTDTNTMFYLNMSILSPIMVPNDTWRIIPARSSLTTVAPQGIVFCLTVVERSSPDSADEQYNPWTRLSQWRPTAPTTGYTPLIASLDRSPSLA